MRIENDFIQSGEGRYEYLVVSHKDGTLGYNLSYADVIMSAHFL
jgi:hypothetical protein